MSSMEIIGSFVLYFASTLSASAGVGGGALNVPILIVIWGFDFHTAVVLSLCTLLGNYLLQVLINLDKRHPYKLSRPLIYWDAILVLLPAELGGANIGVVLSYIIPETVLLIMAMVVLVIAGAAAFEKAIDQHDKETLKFLLEEEKATRLPLLAPPELRSDDEAPKKDKQGDGATGSSSSSSSGKSQRKEGEVGDDSKKEKGLESSSLQPAAAASSDIASTEVAYVEMDIPWTIIAVVLGVWVVYAVLYVLMMDVTICTWEYYSLLVSLYPVLIAELLWGFYYLNDQQAKDPESVLEGDIVWAETSFLPPILAFIIGILSALLGIGGGELMGPLLLSMKVLPQVSAGTTSFMSLLNTSSSIIHYMTLGDVPYTYAAWVFGIGAAGGITGRLLALFVVEKTGRVSILIFMLFVVLVLSFGMFIYDVWVDSVDFSVGSLCDSR